MYEMARFEVNFKGFLKFVVWKKMNHHYQHEFNVFYIQQKVYLSCAYFIYAIVL